MLKLRYYCQVEGEKDIRKLLEDINKKHAIPIEILKVKIDDQELEKQFYEWDFKPRAKLLKQRTGKSIRLLRAKRSGRYCISVPGTIAIISDEDENVQWWASGNEDILNLLKEVLERGNDVLEKLCKP
jgi:hypothetical protein